MVNEFEIVGQEDFYATVYRKGAYVGQIVRNGKKILKETEDGIELKGGIPILIPYGDLVKDAKYTFQEREYHLPKNAHVVGNFKDSIHGLARSNEWKVVERDGDSISLLNEIRDPGYPSKLDVNIRYHLKNRSFDARISITNTGESDAPIVVGAHPYFRVSHPWRLYHHSKIQRLNYPDGVFPDGKLVEYSFNDNDDPGKLNIDHSFVGGGTLRLESAISTVILERRNMDYFEVYNGIYTGENSVAIEPLTGAIDAFNNGIGLQVLPSDKTLECGFTISIL